MGLRTAFSRRNQPRRDAFNYEIPGKVRNRIFATFIHYAKSTHYNPYMTNAKDEVVSALGEIINREHGEWFHDTRTSHGHMVIDHFFCCPTEKAIDIIEWLFQLKTYEAGQPGVDEINRILREEGIGYELSPWGERVLGGHGIFQEKAYSYPEATKKSNEAIHREVVMPTLQLLSGDMWRSANEQLLKSHEHFRKGDFPAAIFYCGAAYETVLKTICQKKGWKYQPNKDPLKPLLDACKCGKLTHDFYFDRDILLSSGHIRNKLGAHGQEPTPTYEVVAGHAEHMIHLTCSHILFLARSAGMK